MLTIETPASRIAADARAVLPRFLSAYWLRPENAFWMALRSATLRQVEATAPAIDVSCGDGVFSFLHAGGAFAPDFDVFQATARLNEVHPQHADMFDGAADQFRPTIIARPTWRYAVGCDLKPALLAKADRLGAHERLVQHDNNQPLPFADDAFATVYCNSAYWVERIDAFLAELRRVTRGDGRVVLHVKLAAMRDYTLEAFEDRLGAAFLRIIGRGRHACWPTVASRGEWERRFARAGFSIERATPFITATHALAWDIGLRPLAPLLTRMANALTPSTRADIKRDWVALFDTLLRPLCAPDFSLAAVEEEPAEMQFVLAP